MSKVITESKFSSNFFLRAFKPIFDRDIKNLEEVLPDNSPIFFISKKIIDFIYDQLKKNNRLNIFLVRDHQLGAILYQYLGIRGRKDRQDNILSNLALPEGDKKAINIHCRKTDKFGLLSELKERELEDGRFYIGKEGDLLKFKYSSLNIVNNLVVLEGSVNEIELKGVLGPDYQIPENISPPNLKPLAKAIAQIKCFDLPDEINQKEIIHWATIKSSAEEVAKDAETFINSSFKDDEIDDEYSLLRRIDELFDLITDLEELFNVIDKENLDLNFNLNDSLEHEFKIQIESLKKFIRSFPEKTIDEKTQSSTNLFSSEVIQGLDNVLGRISDYAQDKENYKKLIKWELDRLRLARILDTAPQKYPDFKKLKQVFEALSPGFGKKILITNIKLLKEYNILDKFRNGLTKQCRQIYVDAQSKFRADYPQQIAQFFDVISGNHPEHLPRLEKQFNLLKPLLENAKFWEKDSYQDVILAQLINEVYDYLKPPLQKEFDNFFDKIHGKKYFGAKKNLVDNLMQVHQALKYQSQHLTLSKFDRSIHNLPPAAFEVFSHQEKIFAIF